MKRTPIEIRVGSGDAAKKFPGSKIELETTDVVATQDGRVVVNLADSKWSAEDVLKRINYAEDLFARRSIRTANTDEGSKTKNRAAAVGWLFKNGTDQQKADFLQLQTDVATGAKTLKDANAFVDDIYEKNLAEEEATAPATPPATPTA